MMTPEPIISERDLRRLQSLPLDAQLAAELDRAVVVASDKVPEDVVTIGSRVAFVDETTGKQQYVQIVEPKDANLAQLDISVLAPVGAALLGLPVGGSIEWQFPDGNTRRLRVQEVVHHPKSGRPRWPKCK